MSNKMALDARGEIRKDMPSSAYKLGDEFKPFHPSASHVRPEWRDGWNACFIAAIAALQAEPQPSAQGPEEIFLQLHGDCLPDEATEPVDYTDDSVTWCWHRIHDSDVRYIRADLAQAEPQGWMPIETAPKDEPVLLATEFDRPGDWRIKAGYFYEETGQWRVWGASWTPTRWMPLPTPPKD